jgi:hypothetical protein
MGGPPNGSGGAARAGSARMGRASERINAGPGAIIYSRDSSTGGTRYTAIDVNRGDIKFTSPTAPTSTTSISNSVTASNVAKAWINLSTVEPGSTITVNGGFNIASVSESGDDIEVTIAADMANTNYACVCSGQNASTAILVGCHTYAAGSFKVDAPAVNLVTTNGAVVNCVVYGAQ